MSPPSGNRTVASCSTPRIAANGAAMRINYQIDGNTNTEKDRAGLRLRPISEVMVEQVKVVTTGFAPEFGQTMGMVYNAVTPSGTNAFKGQGSYLFRRKAFSAFPFFFGCGSTTPAANCPAVSSLTNPQWLIGYRQLYAPSTTSSSFRRLLVL